MGKRAIGGQAIEVQLYGEMFYCHHKHQHQLYASVELDMIVGCYFAFKRGMLWPFKETVAEISEIMIKKKGF